MSKIPSLPNVQPQLLDIPTVEKLAPVGDINHPPRILMLYGSLRERFLQPLSYARGGANPRAVRRRSEDLRSDGVANGRQRAGDPSKSG